MTSARLVGREVEWAAVLAALKDGERLLVLRGPPGVGKSTFARALLAEGKASALVRLDHASTRTAILQQLTMAVGLTLRTDDSRVLFDRLAQRLDERANVVVLDGVDASAALVAAILEDLLDSTSQVAFVVCAWAPLGVPVERVVPLGPLSVASAVELLSSRVRRLAPARQLVASDAEALTSRAAGLPLAIELVAARVAALGAPAVLASLDARGLVSEALDKAIGAAWLLLTPPEREALASLSVFRGAFDSTAARAVIGDAPDLTLLERLSRASLVQSDDDTTAPRFRLLDSIRGFAEREAVSLGVVEGARARHAAFLATPEPPRADEVASWERLSQRRDDLLAAWSWSVLHAPALTAPLAVTLDPMLVTQGPTALHRRVLVETLALTQRRDAATEVDLLLSLGRVDAIRGRFTESLAPFERALALAEQLDDTSRVGWAAAFLCFVFRPLGRFADAQQFGARALECARALRDHRLAAMSEQALGRLAHAQGDLQTATAAQRRAHASATLAKAPRLEGIALTNLGAALQEGGEPSAAHEAFTQARAAFTRSADTFHLARLEVHEAALARESGRLGRALDAVVELEDLEGELEAREGLVHAALALGDARLATLRLGALEAATRFTDDVWWARRVARLRDAKAATASVKRPAVQLSRDGRTLVLGSARFDFSRRGPLRRVVLALLEARLRAPGGALSALEVQDAGWPGEKMFPESGAARVYMAIRRLRALGLEAVLLTTDAGYLLDPHADAAWLDDEA